jgi:polyhydroxyalkanoate synthesis regulator phasin
MAEPAEPNDGGSVREAVERLLLAGVGAAALTKERAEELADDLSQRGQLSREEARDAIDDALHRWRGDALRMSERVSTSLASVVRELGLVTRREWEELELRLAQVEHRLRLVEGSPARATGSPGPPRRAVQSPEAPTESIPPDVPTGAGS